VFANLGTNPLRRLHTAAGLGVREVAAPGRAAAATKRSSSSAAGELGFAHPSRARINSPLMRV
jgi:hypothetical protein